MWITKRTSLASVLLHDEESDALHKINNYIYLKIQNKNTLDVKTCPQSCLLFVFGQTVKAIAVNFVHERNTGWRSYPWSVPAEHESSSAREPALLRWKHNYRVVHLLVNYVFLWSVPAEHDSSSAREPALLRWIWVGFGLPVSVSGTLAERLLLTWATERSAHTQSWILSWATHRSASLTCSGPYQYPAATKLPSNKLDQTMKYVFL